MSLPELQVGDVLLYFENSLIDWAIALKTYNLVAHVEIYAGNNTSVASRNGIGVNRYPLRKDGLVYIRRPIKSIMATTAMYWFNRPFNPITNEGIKGQKYDWLGLLCFTLAVKQGSSNKMFCSEFGVRWFRMAGLDIVARDYDADKTAPAQFLQSPSLVTIYNKYE